MQEKDNFDAIKRGCYFKTLKFFAFGAKQMNTIFLFEKKIVLSDSYKHINQIK